ncbi:MAG TPA: AbrB/MazE/SpoVT family DNA-binding domain-containing protein [Sphingopyxis sp.]|nr:AbrB/MazE/SpoVT family DNA-binding domain-containing protein [Sphingopyxis sp.]
MSYHAKLIKGGKIVIPAELRRELGFDDGDTLVVERHGDAVVLRSEAATLRDIRAKVKAGLKRPVSVESYLKDKWAEAALESPSRSMPRRYLRYCSTNRAEIMSLPIYAGPKFPSSISAKSTRHLWMAA